MDTVTQWEALRALKLAVDAAIATACATPVESTPTEEGAKALADTFMATVYPAFRKALYSGVPYDEAMKVFGPGALSAVKRGMTNTVAKLRREEAEARRAAAADAALRVQAAPQVDVVARRQALCGLKLLAETARAEGTRSHVATLVTALRNAVNASVPLAVAIQVLERAGVPVSTVLGTAIAASQAQAADAETRVQPGIPLAAPARDSEAVAANADVRVEAATPTSNVAPDADPSEADLRLIDGAVTTLGATFTEPERRIAAEAMSELRTLANWEMQRAERHRRQPFSVCRTVRRPRASRAPRRAGHRSAVAPARDGPPPSDDPPRPVIGRSTPDAVGGSR